MPARSNLRRRLWAASCHPALVLAGVAAVLPGCQPQAVPTADSTATTAEVDTCGGPATAIASLPRRSGSGIAEMGRITVEGVVVGVFQAGLNGYFLQSGAGDDDGNEGTPEGVFVELSDTATAPKVGERLRVAGKWSRSDDRAAATWALREVDQVQRCADAMPPPVVELSAPPADWASLSGMRVRIPGPAVLSGNESLLRYGEATIAFGDTRLYAATEQKRPGPSAREAEQDNRHRSLLLDDGRTGEYARNLWWLPQPVSAQAPYRAGSLLGGLEGVIDHRHGRWRLQLLRPAGSVQQAPRPEPPGRAEGSVRVASFNVLNFFNGDGSGGGFPTDRGAASPDLQQRQRSKLVAAMRQLDADVIALMEVENDGFGADSAVAELVAALAGPSRRGSASIPWHAVRPDGLDLVGRDVITVGLMYRADRVEPVGPARTLAVAPFDDHSRMPLAQTFRPLGGSSEARPFVVVVNHFKSKGGCNDADEANTDQGDGQACYNAVRLDSAQALADWLAAESDGVGADATLILGDLNAYRREDPIRALTRAGYRDLLAAADDAESAPPHSFVFQGQAGLLDHALAGKALVDRVVGAGVWSINADELPEFAYDGDNRSGRRLYAADPWRSSDHDPVWVDLTP